MKIRGGMPRISRICSRRRKKKVVKSEESPWARAASIMFCEAWKRLTPRPPGISRVSRREPSGFSAYSPFMRMPRSGFQQTTTITGTVWRFSTAARPVTERPAPSVSCAFVCARSGSMTSNASDHLGLDPLADARGR